MSELSNKERVLKIAIALEELNLKKEIAKADEKEVMEYLKNEFLTLCQRPNIREEVECALTDNDRVDYVLEVMRSI
jgi:hypothetical protein